MTEFESRTPYSTLMSIDTVSGLYFWGFRQPLQHMLQGGRATIFTETVCLNFICLFFETIHYEHKNLSILLVHGDEFDTRAPRQDAQVCES
jgi:hypothetical protein